MQQPSQSKNDTDSYTRHCGLFHIQTFSVALHLGKNLSSNFKYAAIQELLTGLMRKPPAKAAFRRVHGRQRSGVAASGLSTLASWATCPGLQNITMMVVQIGGGIGAIESNSHLLHVTSLPLVQENKYHINI